MRKVISLSALVSGLLAAPGIAAPAVGVGGVGAARPRSEEVDRGAVVTTEEVLTAEEKKRLQGQLLEMVEKGPEDVGGMMALQRRIGLAMQEQVAAWLATNDGAAGDVHLIPVEAVDLERGPGLFPPEMREQTEKAAFLGVTTSPVTAALRDQLGLAKGFGLVVDFVAKDSPAEAAGLKVHDVLTKFEDQRVVNIEQLAVLVRSKKGGDSVTLTVIRGGKEQTLTAKLVEKEVPVMEEEGEAPMTFWMPGEAAPRAEGGVTWNEDDRRTVISNPDGSTTRTYRDSEGEITLTTGKDGKANLVARDKEGKEIYRGAYDTAEEKAKVPAAIAARIPAMRIEDGNGVGKSGDLHAGKQLMLTRSDADQVITLRGNKGAWQAEVKDAKTGKVVFEGAANSDEDFKKMPEGVAEKVRKMLGMVGKE